MRRLPKTFSKARRYGHAVGRVMVHESTLLEWQHVERMIESTFRSAIDVTMETVYGPYLEGSTTSHEIDSGLMRFLEDEYRFLDEISSGTLVAEFMHLKYDYHNLRVVLKRRQSGQSEADSILYPLGSVDPGRIERAVDEGLTAVLPDHLLSALERASSASRAGADPQVIDTVLDREYLERRLRIAVMERSPLLIDFCRAAIDVANLRVILRALNLGKSPEYVESALADGGSLERDNLVYLYGQPFDYLAERLLDSEYGLMLSDVLSRGERRVRLTSFDQESDDRLLEAINGFKAVSVGPERIVKYMMARENEVAVLRIILMGKLHYLSAEVIEARLPTGNLKELYR